MPWAKARRGAVLGVPAASRDRAIRDPPPGVPAYLLRCNTT
jgi:hypothetical protein